MRTSLIFLISTNIFLTAFLFNSVQSQINTQNEFLKQESRIIEKLKFIRQLQIVYKSQKGHYASDWQQLGSFGKSDTIYTISKKEVPILNTSGMAGSLRFEIDTLQTSVFDSIFAKSSYTLSELKNVPGFESSAFTLSTDTIDINGIRIEVVEVTVPVSPDKKKNLKFGSLQEPTLAGNWK